MNFSIKDLSMEAIMLENKDYVYLKPSMIKRVIDFTFSKEDDYIKIEFESSYGKKLDLIASFSDFKRWWKKDKKDSKKMMLNFVKDFMASSSEKDDIEEIIDADGNIMPDQDMPSNSTNRMVVGPKFDLEKIYRQSIYPKYSRYLGGDYGRGFVVW